MFKKKQKWFNMQGTLLEKRWAKGVIEIEPVFKTAYEENGITSWGVAVILEDNSRRSWIFKNYDTALSARESLVKWIKEVQS